jgi:hypothetical protein
MKRHFILCFPSSFYAHLPDCIYTHTYPHFMIHLLPQSHFYSHSDIVKQMHIANATGFLPYVCMQMFIQHIHVYEYAIPIHFHVFRYIPSVVVHWKDENKKKFNFEAHKKISFFLLEAHRLLFCLCCLAVLCCGLQVLLWLSVKAAHRFRVDRGQKAGQTKIQSIFQEIRSKKQDIKDFRWDNLQFFFKFF